MARILKGATVDGLRGKVGSVIFAGVRGGTAAKRHIRGPDPKSDAQVSVRAAFTLVKDSWLSVAAGIRNSWVRFGDDLRGTGYNFFLSANIGQERTDDWRALTPINYKVAGVESVEMESGPEEGEATIRWEAGSANPAHQGWAFVREVETSAVIHKAWWVADVSAGMVVVDGLTVGKEYRFYISVYDSALGEGWKFSESLECLGEAEEGPAPTIWFEAYHETEDLSEYDGSEINGSGKIAVTSGRAKDGVWSVRAELGDPGPGDYARVWKYGLNIAVGNKIYTSGWWWFPSSFNLRNPLYLYKLEQAGSPYKGIKTILNGDEELFIYDDINGASYVQGSPISVPREEWVGIETKIYAHESEGILELWQGAARIIQVTGIDTMPSANYTKLLFGAYYNAGDQDYDIDLGFDVVCVQNQRKIV